MARLQTCARVEVQVLVDNVTDFLSSTPAFVLRETVFLQQRRGMRRLAGECLCCAAFGLSLVITAYPEAGGDPHTVLFDAGPEGFAVAHNARRLGTDLAAVEAVVLSHGHFDHAGGLPRALELIHAANGQRRVPCYLHPGMFRERAMRQSDGGLLPLGLVPTPQTLELAGAAPVVTDQPQVIADGCCYVSGEIPRVTPFEFGLPSQVQRDEAGAWRADVHMRDERFLAVRLAGRGVFVFTACSHAGVVNVLTHARDVFAGDPLFAVMGGFHLSGEHERIIPDTVRALGEFGLTHIFPAHCTGWRALSALERAYGDAVVVPASVGKLFTL